MTTENTNAAIIERCETDLIIYAGRVNQCADEGDHNRNRVNYGIARHSAAMLDYLNQTVRLCEYEDDGFLRISMVRINDRVVDF